MTNHDAWLYIANLWKHPVQGNFGMSEKTFTGIRINGRFIISLFDSIRALVPDLITHEQAERMLDDLSDYCLGCSYGWNLTPVGAAERSHTCVAMASGMGEEEDL